MVDTTEQDSTTRLGLWWHGLTEDQHAERRGGQM